MHDPEDEHHALALDHVVHHPVVANPEPVEGVRRPLDRLHGLAADPPRRRGILRELLERARDPRSGRRVQLLECPERGRRELDVVGTQLTSSSLVV